MAENLVLEAQQRTVAGKKVSQLRRQGLIPVIVYGPKNEPKSLQVPARPLQLALMKAGGTHLIDIKVNGDTHTVLAREVQRDILRGDIIHVDFFAVDLKAKINIDVPVHYINESPAVIAKLGILITGPSVLTVETLPTNLPEKIDVDISLLKQIGDAVHVRDLVMGEGIVILNDPDELIARISQTSAARADEAEEAAAAEGVPVEVEIIKKGKADEEAEE